jgi:integrase
MQRKLTETKIKHAKPKADGRPQNFSDGGGLYLHVKPLGKYWRYNFRINDKMKTLSLGAYPTIGLAEVRELHEQARALLANGIDPCNHKRLMKQAQLESSLNSFEAIALAWYEHKQDNWSESHKKRTMAYLAKDVFPWVGNHQMDDLTAGQIISIVQRVEERGAPDAARRVKQYISQVFSYAVTLGLAKHNPVSAIKNDIILKPRVKQHYATVTEPSLIGQLLRDIDAYQGTLVVRVALQLSPLVMLRPGELRAAEWSEIDLEQGLWTIPIKRMKAPTHIKRANKSAHYVPLSRQAIALLSEIYPLTGRYKYVFPGARGVSRPLSDNGLRAALRTMGYDNETMTPHGFRAMASSLLNRVLDKEGRRRWDRDLIEQQLAHVDGTVRGHYNRADTTDALQQRRAMLQAWANYLDELKAYKNNIVSFKR